MTIGTGDAEYICWLGEPACGDRARVGGKTAQLSRLAAQQRVPAGFCLTTAAYDLAAGMLAEGAAAPAEDLVLPPLLFDALGAAYATLAARCGEAAPAVAVRSSAVDEDGSDASFAGQLETYLNVRGADAVAVAVVQCWMSARAPRALEYRRREGLTGQGGQVAVLVQQLIVADVAGVAFSANPISGSRDEVVINASWGLGESIVGGTVTPDTFVVGKADGRLLSAQIADKAHMTVAVPGGTREVAVPHALRTRRTLDDAQVATVARLALALEAALGRPVDLEYAWKAGSLYLLQCRPITTLAGPDAPPGGDAHDHERS